MNTIELQFVLENRTYPDAGTIVFSMIEEMLVSEGKIVLDMNGVSALPSMFLNVSIGAFIDKYGVETLKKRIAFANISTVQTQHLKSYLEKYTISK